MKTRKLGSVVLIFYYVSYVGIETDHLKNNKSKEISIQPNPTLNPTPPDAKRYTYCIFVDNGVAAPSSYYNTNKRWGGSSGHTFW